MVEGLTLAGKIVALLGQHPDGLTDAQIASQLGVVHQQVNARCRQLAATGVLRRDDSGHPIKNSLGDHRAAPAAPKPVERTVAKDEWHWEGTVQAVLVRWLVLDGWVLLRVADTARKDRGTDIEAQRAGVRLHIEVKGYPSKSSADPARADEVKPTQPTLQAGHWYSHALLKVLQLRQEHPDDAVGLGLPDSPATAAC